MSGDISTKTLDQRWYTQFRIGRWENGQSVVNEGSQFPNDENSIDQFFRQMTPDTGIKCTLCQGHYDFSFSDFYFIFVCCVEASK